MSSADRVAMPDAQQGIETAAQLMRAHIVSRGGSITVRLLAQRMPLDRAPFGQAFGLLVSRRQIVVDETGLVRVVVHPPPEAPHPVRRVLGADELAGRARGNTAAMCFGAVLVAEDELKHAAQHGLDLVVRLGPAILAWMGMAQDAERFEVVVRIGEGG